MSAIAGSICFARDESVTDVASPSFEFLKRFGADGYRCWRGRRGSFHYFSRLATPEDRFDKQPIFDEASGFLLVFDGRLDNRDEVARTVRFDLSNARSVSDSEIVFRFLVRFGVEGCSDLIGDFAFAFWDTRGQRVWLVRDAMAARPLVWRITKDSQLHFSSNPVALLSIDGSSIKFNHDVLYDTMCGLPLRSSKTLFRGIEKVRGGEVVEFGEKSIKRWFFHRFDARRSLSGIRSDECAERLFELLQESVQCRLRGISGVASQLSAGFDSSAVTAVAAELRGQCKEQLTALTAIPRSGFGDAIPGGCIGNEGPMARLVAERFSNVLHLEVESPEGRLLELIDSMVASCAYPPREPFGLLWDWSICCHSKKAGASILLTGACGNQTLSYDGAFYLSSLLGRLRWIKWFQEVRSESDHSRRRSLRAQSLLPHKIALKRLLSGSKRYGSFDPTLYCPMSRDFASDMADEGFLLERLKPHPYRPWADGRPMVAEYLNRHDDSEHNLWTDLHGLDRRDPTGDRRLAEFCLGLPESEFWGRGTPRHICFRALNNLLPKEILTNRSFGYQGADWWRTAELELDDIRERLKEMSLNQTVTGYIDVGYLLGLLESWPKAGFERRSVIHRYRNQLFRGLSLASFLCYDFTAAVGVGEFLPRRTLNVK